MRRGQIAVLGASALLAVAGATHLAALEGGPLSMVSTAPDRASRHAFVLAGGTIVTSDLEAAGAALTALGWVDRPLEILGPDRRPARAGGPPLSPIAELAKKDRLTRAEAMQLLDTLP